MIKTGVLYHKNYYSKADTIVNQGGTSSGKTYAILQVLFTKALEEECTITVVGQDIPNLKVGAFRDALDIINSDESIKQQIFHYNRSDRIFTFKNKSIMEFNSYDNQQDAKSGKRDYLFVNEANGIPYNMYEQLSLRTRKQVYIDYNPDTSFWVHEKIIPLDTTELIISDHRHNPFLSSKVREKIEALKERDESLWKVYARGITGRIEGLVLKKWYVLNESFEDKKIIGYGIDFGFSNDPSTLIEVRMQDGDLYVRELIYETGLTNQDISDRMEALGVSKGALIVADSAEPKSIEELRRRNWTVDGVKKGKDSVMFGINLLKGYKINVNSSSTNLIKELEQYRWKVDKNGNTLNVPIDEYNHAIDALRYLIMHKFSKKGYGQYTVI
ncbi:MAG: PBSX family phage terminase large subunit [Flavobacteriia bacterium]|nr:PBSX family phage terminase large subunit [Flavobacteriia bacterium]